MENRHNRGKLKVESEKLKVGSRYARVHFISFILYELSTFYFLLSRLFIKPDKIFDISSLNTKTLLNPDSEIMVNSFAR